MTLLFSTLLLSVTIFSGCDDDDQSNGSFEISVQEKETHVSVSKATLTVSAGQTSGSGQGSHALRIAGGVMEDSISILISNWDFQEPLTTQLSQKTITMKISVIRFLKIKTYVKELSFNIWKAIKFTRAFPRMKL